MLKVFKKIYFLIAVFFITLLNVFILTSCFANNSSSNSNDGTYYKYNDNNYDKTSYFIISNSSWEDEDGEKGNLSITGSTIVFYISNSSKEELYSGTISNGVITLNIMGENTYYCKEGSKPSGSSTPTVDTFTVSFETNGGSSITSQTVNKNSTAIEPKDPTRDGFLFDGWYSDSSFNNKFDFSTKVTSNITLYAKWVEITDTNSVTLSFETNGGTEITSQKVLIGNAAIKPDNPTKEGFIFDGWYSDSAFTKAYNFSTLISTNKTIYAKWVLDCVVTFVNYDGTNLKSYHVKYGESVVYDGVTPTHKDNEYVFIGWDKSLNSVKESMTINAIFEKVLEGTNGFEYSLSTDKTYYIIEGIGDINEEEVIVPYTFNNLPIKEISSGAISGLTNTKKIIIQSNIEKIGSKAITGCTNLEEIVLPFVGESKTTTTNISFDYIFDNIPSKLTTIRVNGGEIKGTMNNKGGFNKLNNSNVRNIYLSSAVTKGGYYGFGATLSEIKLYIEDEDSGKYAAGLGPITYFNAGIDTMTTIDGITYLIEGNNATIVDCNRYLSSVNISSNISINGKSYSITKVGEKAFRQCLNLSNAQLPSSIKTFEKEAFAYCNSLATINMPSSLIEIGANAFEHCVLLTSLTLPTNLIKIGSNAFKNCEEITTISLNDNLEYIDYNAFYNCSKLTNLSIPTSVYYIGSNALYGCSKLTYNKITSGNGIGDYLGNSNNQYLWLIKASGSSTSYVMNNNTKHIYPYAFSNLQSINNMTYTLSSNLETIGENAFGNTKFTSINIPSSVYWIDDYVFEGKSISSIVLPTNLKYLGDYAFSNCTSLDEIELPKKLEYLGAGAFYNCAQLKEVNIPDSIIEIRSDTFNGCTNLEDIIFNNVTTIGASAFYNCKKLLNVFLDDKVLKVGDNCFYGDSQLNIYIKGTEIPTGFDENFNPSNANIIFVDKIPTARGLKVYTSVNNEKAGIVTDLSDNKYIEGQSVTITATTNAGYTFVGWYDGNNKVYNKEIYTFTMPDTNVTYEARWTANTNTSYKVEHYLQNIKDSSYPSTPYETDNLTGITDTLTNAKIKTYTGFTSPTTITQVNINGDGKTVIKVYYTRDIYTVNLSQNNEKAGTITGAGTYKYGETVTIAITTNAGYTYNGLYKDNNRFNTETSYSFNMPANDLSYEARWTANKYTITLNNQAEGVSISGIISGGKYEVDSQITLTATNIPDGYTIKWSRSDGIVYAKDSIVVIVPAINITITTIVTPPYTRNDAKIYFGTYPQTKVTDNTLISELNTLAGTKPTSTNSYNWTDYNYYISSSITSFMFYQDIDYDNDGDYDYRGVYFTQYRPKESSSTNYTYQDDNGYSTNTIYWFSYDPIEWDILTESNGKALILANLILDSQAYYPSDRESSFKHNGGTGYANNYELSAIRKFLNDNFYNTSFNDIQKALIEETTVDNSMFTTQHNSPYACNNTNDKLFLLSYEDATSSTYGLNSYTARQAKGTDYAKSQGLFVSTSSSYLGNAVGWWLRSPNANSGLYANYVNYKGEVYDKSYEVFYTMFGIRPACWIIL